MNTGRSVWRGLLSTSFFWLVVVAMPGCATMGTLTNLSDESCRLSFTRALSSVLSYEGEQPERSMAMASSTASTLLAYDLGPVLLSLSHRPAPITGFLSTVRGRTVC